MFGRCNQWLVLVLANVSIGLTQRLKERHSWLHTSEEIHAELRQLSSSCSGAVLSMSKRTSSGRGPRVELDVIHVSRAGSKPGRKAFYVFGEHARELISPESALHFVRLLCGDGDPVDRELAQKALEGTSFVIIPNANPLGRKQVDLGQYCKRTNEEGVDLNRNWDGVSGPVDSTGLDAEVNPGPYAFSEPETRLLRDILLEEKPDMFLSVHSGAYLLGTPTISESLTNEDTKGQTQLAELLADISQQFCNGDCPFGGLTEVIGYKSQGCDIDYVQNHTTPYAFTWEIYANSEIRQFFAEKARAHTEGREMNAAAQTYFSMKSLMFLQAQHGRGAGQRLRGNAKALALESPEESDNEDCFAQFNPTTQAETEEVVANWGKAFLTLPIQIRALPRVKRSLN